MTAVSHDSVRNDSRTARRTTSRTAGRSGSRGRVVRPRTMARTSAGSGGAATLSLSGAITAPAGVSVTPARLVLAGSRIRLGDGAFVVAVLGALSAALVVLLFLNTSLAEDSFGLQTITKASRDLTIREQVLRTQLDLAESPVGLSKKARKLGMVSADSPNFIALEQGKILGDSMPAQAPVYAKPKPPKPVPTPITPVVVAPATATGLGGEVPVGPVWAGGEQSANLGVTAAPPPTLTTGGGEVSLGIVQVPTR